MVKAMFITYLCMAGSGRSSYGVLGGEDERGTGVTGNSVRRVGVGFLVGSRNSNYSGFLFLIWLNVTVFFQLQHPIIDLLYIVTSQTKVIKIYC